MLYFDAPTAARADDLQRANVVAAQVAFALDRTRTKEQAPQRGAYSVCAGRGVDGQWIGISEAGYSGYLAKPIDAGQLARTVRNVVAAPTAA